MAYNCIVLIKQVPDTKKITVQAMNDDGTVNRGALPAIFNPEDLNALETALEIKQTYGGKVTVITMGLPAAAAILRDSQQVNHKNILLDRHKSLFRKIALNKYTKKVDFNIDRAALCANTGFSLTIALLRNIMRRLA